MNKTTLTTLLLFTFFSLSVIAQDTEDTVYVSATGAGLSDGSSEANAYGNFGNALGQINSEGDKLVIIGTITSNGANLTTKNFPFTIEGLDANSIITGASGARRLFTINGATSANVTFKDLTFSGNSTTLAGGSVLFNNIAGATVTFNNCTITNNSVTNGAGGGALFFANGNLNIINSSFENNTSSDEAGAIFGQSGTITITNSLFKSNTAATKGGALYANSANFVITGSTFYDNQTTNATDAGGSVLYVAQAGSTNSITNCTFFQNTTGSANQDYGTIRTDNGNTTVSNSLFYDNKTNNGTGGPSDWGAGGNGIQTFETSIAQWITTNVDIQDVGAGSITGIKGNLGTPANLTSSNLTFNPITGKVEYDAVNVGENSPIDFGSDGNDVGAWDSGLTLLSPDTTLPVITLIGEAVVSIEIGSTYVDGGATASDNVDGDITSNITTDVSDVDEQTVGSYTVYYNVSDLAGNAAIEVTRTVNVVDTSIPVITLTGDEIVTIEVGTTYADAGATATDNYDDDTTLTASITTDVSNVDNQTVGSYSVTYNVSDVAGNVATEVTRTVNVVDTNIPFITLTGEAIVTIEVGSTYVDGGATASDNVDGDITSNITTDVTNVDNSTVGSYTVTYNVTDASGNVATEVTRTVNVVDTTAPVITLTGDAIVTNEGGTGYADGGATATDNYDDNTTLTASITTDVSNVDEQTVGSYTVYYNVSDLAGNAAIEVTRTVNVIDTTIPVITLTGDAVVTIVVDATYLDAGATAFDTVDSDLTTAIVVSGTVDVSTVGVYILRYNVTDTTGNVAVEVTRTVNVVDETTINLLLPINGGGLDSYTSTYGGNYGPELLTNGITSEAGWASADIDSDPTLPEFVYSFSDGQTATLQSSVIYGGTAEDEYFSKDVEVWTSTDGTNYNKIAEGTLGNFVDDAIILDLGGIVAKNVKLVITSGYDESYWELGEFEVYGEISESLGVDKTEINPINVYPNPTASNWTVESSNIINSVKLFNLLGQKVLEQTANDTKVNIDASAFKTGVYMLQINNTTMKRLIKK
ncbi:DUF5011 domain-containing protein [Flavobacteriaceae bacterium]|nr:DUF5011 domain-containing protein [Flavobacteriaceae bacterium]